MRVFWMPFAVVLLSGCPAPPAGAARAQEAAQEANLNARFGRMELAIEKTGPKGRDVFLSHRSAWGSTVRIIDTELAGVRLVKDDQADVTVRVTWQRVDEGYMRTTRIRQRWKDFKGDWKLEQEERMDGDLGLLGEVVQMKPVERKNAQFPTVRIGSND